VNRDNALFVLIGLLAGFIAGYLVQDIQVDRQAPRLVHGDDAAAPPGAGAAPTGSPGTAAAGAEGDAAARAQGLMEEMRGLEGYLAENPDDAEATLRLGTLAIEVGNWGTCVQALERYVELRGESPDLLSDLGICYRGIGRVDRALALFDRAQEIEPDHWQSRFNEAMVLGLDQRDFEAAERVLDELRSLRPGDPGVERLAEAIEQRRPA
jgi:Flp pilus assembly protein TadD